VVVAVIAVRMMEMVGHEVVDVIGVRHGLVAASLPVDVLVLVSVAAMIGRAALGVAGVGLDHVLVHVVLVRVMEMAVVQVVDVVAVRHGRVSAAGLVAVSVIWVSGVRVHADQFRQASAEQSSG
jgi:hypothetical protein